MISASPDPRAMTARSAYEALELNHQRFVDALLVHPTASAAYRSVYSNASPSSSRAAAARLLADVRIEAALEERRVELAERTNVTAERIIGELAAIAFSNMRTFALGTRWRDADRRRDPERRGHPVRRRGV
jgi:phage terminase small subunit